MRISDIAFLILASSLPRPKMLQVAGENCTVWQGYDFFGNFHCNDVARQVAEKIAQCNSTFKQKLQQQLLV